MPKSGLAERACKAHAWPKLSGVQFGVSLKRAEVLEDDSYAKVMSICALGIRRANENDENDHRPGLDLPVISWSLHCIVRALTYKCQLITRICATLTLPSVW